MPGNGQGEINQVLIPGLDSTHNANHAKDLQRFGWLSSSAKGWFVVQIGIIHIQHYP
jgi:hypothetical protein